MREDVSEVFGIAQKVRRESYVDRSGLDEELARLLERDVHIAIRGASKTGKSWLRQTVIGDPLVVHCRHKTTTIDLYKDALAQLGVEFQVERASAGEFKASVKARGEVGLKLLAKVGLDIAASQADMNSTTYQPVGHEVTNVAFVADVLKASGSKLIIEDFHYLSVDERRNLAFDLKLFWDMELFVVIIGVWTQPNLLVVLNPDMRGRVHEVLVDWSSADLRAILEAGGRALGIEFESQTIARLVDVSYSNPGVLQLLTLAFLDEMGITRGFDEPRLVGDPSKVEDAAMAYAFQLEQFYSEWASRLSSGIRQRRNATGVYAHALAVILGADDAALLDGLDRKTIFGLASAREPRLQAGNLRTALRKFETLQVDDQGRGLVLGYQDSEPGRVVVIDRELLLYRRFMTTTWPWEGMSEDYSDDLEGDQDADGK